MSEYSYYNSYGNKNTTTTQVNMCERKGSMSMCMAVTMADQEGCKYRVKASRNDRCMFYREDMEGACDNTWAQRGVDMPESIKEG